MTARTHDLAAITAFGVVLLTYLPDDLSLSTFLVAVFANQLGGIAPDIDQPTAPLWRNLPEGHFVGRVFGKLLGGHRFLSHSLLGFALFGWLSYLLLGFLQPIIPHIDTNMVWWAFMIGYGSHLVMDTLTKEGVPWLLPIPIKFGIPPVKRFRITTGHFVELGVVLPLLIIFDIWLCAFRYVDIVQLFRSMTSN